MNKTINLKSTRCKSLIGIISVPTDKSISHRCYIIASQCVGVSKIKGLNSDDVKALAVIPLKNLYCTFCEKKGKSQENNSV